MLRSGVGSRIAPACRGRRRPVDLRDYADGTRLEHESILDVRQLQRVDAELEQLLVELRLLWQVAGGVREDEVATLAAALGARRRSESNRGDDGRRGPGNSRNDPPFRSLCRLLLRADAITVRPHVSRTPVIAVQTHSPQIDARQHRAEIRS